MNTGATTAEAGGGTWNAGVSFLMQLHASLMPGRLLALLKRQQSKFPAAAGCLTQSKIHQVEPVGL